jgi:DNA-binding GntR family transcriptional regulator
MSEMVVMTKDESLDHAIRREIIHGVLAPASRLRMEDLKARFDVGFSPIREALSRLAGEGLVEFEANRGFRVTPLSRADLADVAVTRCAVEVAALRLSIAQGDEQWEASLIAAMHLYRRRAASAFDSAEALAGWEAAHDALHAALIGACGSSRLLALQRQLQDQHIRYRRLIVIPQVAGDVHVEEHERLVALALDRDVDAAVVHIERHMMITADALQGAHFWESAGQPAG